MLMFRPIVSSCVLSGPLGSLCSARGRQSREKAAEERVQEGGQAAQEGVIRNAMGAYARLTLGGGGREEMRDWKPAVATGAIAWET